MAFFWDNSFYKIIFLNLLKYLSFVIYKVNLNIHILVKFLNKVKDRNTVKYLKSEALCQ